MSRYSEKTEAYFDLNTLSIHLDYSGNEDNEFYLGNLELLVKHEMSHFVLSMMCPSTIKLILNNIFIFGLTRFFLEMCDQRKIKVGLPLKKWLHSDFESNIHGELTEYVNDNKANLANLIELHKEMQEQTYVDVDIHQILHEFTRDTLLSEIKFALYLDPENPVIKISNGSKNTDIPIGRTMVEENLITILRKDFLDERPDVYNILIKNESNKFNTCIKDNNLDAIAEYMEYHFLSEMIATKLNFKDNETKYYVLKTIYILALMYDRDVLNKNLFNPTSFGCENPGRLLFYIVNAVDNLGTNGYNNQVKYCNRLFKAISSTNISFEEYLTKCQEFICDHYNTFKNTAKEIGITGIIEAEIEDMNMSIRLHEGITKLQTGIYHYICSFMYNLFGIDKKSKLINNPIDIIDDVTLPVIVGNSGLLFCDLDVLNPTKSRLKNVGKFELLKPIDVPVPMAFYYNASIANQILLNSSKLYCPFLENFNHKRCQQYEQCYKWVTEGNSKNTHFGLCTFKDDLIRAYGNLDKFYSMT